MITLVPDSYIDLTDEKRRSDQENRFSCASARDIAFSETATFNSQFLTLLPSKREGINGQRVLSNAAAALLLLAILFLVIDIVSRHLVFGGTLILVCLIAAVGLAATNEVARRTLS